MCHVYGFKKKKKITKSHTDLKKIQIMHIHCEKKKLL